jgi:hypothetical protein
MMPRILIIDPSTRSVTEGTIEQRDHEAVSKYMSKLSGVPNCIFTTGTHLPGGSVVYVDDEGLLRNPEVLCTFVLPTYSDPLPGIGVVIGAEYETDKEWGWHDVPQSDIDYVKQHITYLWYRRRAESA